MAAGDKQQGTPENIQVSNAAGTPEPHYLTVVGTGASAGGIQALQPFGQRP